MPHNHPSYPTPHRLHTIRRRYPIVQPPPPRSKARVARRDVRTLLARYWAELVLVAIVVLPIAWVLRPRPLDFTSALPTYPNSSQITHTLDEVIPEGYHICCGTYLNQTLNFQTPDTAETVLAFYQTHSAIRAANCRVTEQTITVLAYTCTFQQPAGPSRMYTIQDQYRIEVTTGTPQTYVVQVTERHGNKRWWRGN